MSPSRIPCTGSTCWSGGDSSVQLSPLSVERKIPCCSVPIHRSCVTGLKPSPNTLPPVEGEVLTPIIVCPPLEETHAPLVGAGAQNPPHTRFALAATTHPVVAGLALRWPDGIKIQ